MRCVQTMRRQADIIGYCNKPQNCIAFAIGASRDKAVMRQINRSGGKGWQPYGGGNGRIAGTADCLNEGREAFRLIVARRPVQASLLPVACFRVVMNSFRPFWRNGQDP